MFYKRISVPVPAVITLAGGVVITLTDGQKRGEELFDRILFGRITPVPETFNDPRKAGALAHLATHWVKDHPEVYRALPNISQFTLDAAVLDLEILEKKNEPDQSKRPPQADLDAATANISGLLNAELKPYIDALRAGTDTVPGYIKIGDLFDDWVTSGMRDWFFQNLHVLTGVFQKKPAPPPVPPGTPPPPAVGWGEWGCGKASTALVLACAFGGVVISGLFLAAVTALTLMLMAAFWVGNKLSGVGTPAVGGQGLTGKKVGAGFALFLLAIGPLPVFILCAAGVIGMVGYFLWPFYTPPAFLFMGFCLTFWLMRLFLVVSDMLLSPWNEDQPAASTQPAPAPVPAAAPAAAHHVP